MRATENEIEWVIANFAEDEGYDSDRESKRKRNQQIIRDALKAWDVIFVADDSEQYEGIVGILLQNKDSKELGWVSGSHCSCYGFEGQWLIEPMHEDVLRTYLDNEWYPERTRLINQYFTEKGSLS